MRGYGESDKPSAITAYNQVEIVNDIKGLVDTLGYETAIVIGHDWGGPYRMVLCAVASGNFHRRGCAVCTF